MTALSDALARLDEIKRARGTVPWAGSPIYPEEWVGENPELVLSALEEARDLLRAIEWAGNCCVCGYQCPKCGAFKDERHEHDCALALAIGAPRRTA